MASNLREALKAGYCKTDKSVVEEIYDEPEILEEKIQTLAQFISESQHFVCFTGAGISTSVGIADFRSGINTKLETGAGLWAQESAARQGKLAAPKKKRKYTSILRTVPSESHMALKGLYDAGILKHVISQNFDGLHMKSGLLREGLSELHGNSFLEICATCGHRYLRDFKVRKACTPVHEHATDRMCSVKNCKGELHDTLVNFDEQLPDEDFAASEMHCEQADLCLAMGSSLTVSPACDFPEMVAENNGRLVIINIQRTPLDDLCALRIHARIDDVLPRVMEILQISIPEFRLKRRVIFSRRKQGRTTQLRIRAVDESNTTMDIFSNVALLENGVTSRQVLQQAPFHFTMKKGKEAQVILNFYGNYKEKALRLDLSLKKKTTVDLEWNPFAKRWNFTYEE